MAKIKLLVDDAYTNGRVGDVVEIADEFANTYVKLGKCILVTKATTEKAVASPATEKAVV